MLFLLVITLTYLNLHAKARQSAALVDLWSVTNSEIAYYSEKKVWSDSFEDIGWGPASKVNYSFYLADNYDCDYYGSGECKTAIKRRDFKFGKKITPPIGLYGGAIYLIGKEMNMQEESEREVLHKTAFKYGIGASPGGFTAVAIGNIDDDPELDVWIVNQEKMPKNVQSDVNDLLSNILSSPIEKLDNATVIYPDRMIIPLIFLNLAFWGATMIIKARKSKIA